MKLAEKGSALLLGVALTVTGFSQGSPGPIVESQTVLPATFNDALSIRDNEEGDRFSVTVKDDNGAFPKATKIEGHVVRIRWGNRFRPPAMDLQFDDVLYPDGHTLPIDAVPIPLDSRGIRHGRDGRLYMSPTDRANPGAYWAAGTIGGLIVGGIFNRPFLGGFIGSIVGAIAGHAAVQNPDNYRVARKGDKIGVLFRSDVTADGHSAPAPHQTWGPARRSDVRLGDQPVSFPDQQPFWQGETLMVPLPAMADAMDLTVDQREDGPIYIENEDNMLHLEQGSDSYRLNGTRGTLPTPVINRDGTTFAPIDIFAAISARTVYVNGTKLQKKP
jgi:hypothetical protein